jgi:ABC-type amino acid transport substrate-binding protein
MHSMHLFNSSLRRALAVVLTGAVMWPSAQAQDGKPTLAKVAETGTMRVAYRESSVPFSYLDNAKPIGFGVEVCDRVIDAVKAKVKKPDLKIELQAVTSQNRIPLLMNGTIDIECGSTTNNKARNEQVDFAINYFYTGTRLLTKKGSGIKNYADLRGKSVSTTSGTTNFQVLRKYITTNNFTDINVLAGKDHADSFLSVENGRAVAFAMDDILLYGLAANAKNPAEWEVVGDALQVEPYAVMVRKGDPEFKKLVDETIAGLIKSGDFEKLYKKWFQSPIPPRGANLNVPMNEELRANMKALSDAPAQ